jgi:hypothetical protein
MTVNSNMAMNTRGLVGEALPSPMDGVVVAEVMHLHRRPPAGFKGVGYIPLVHDGVGPTEGVGYNPLFVSVRKAYPPPRFSPGGRRS